MVAHTRSWLSYSLETLKGKLYTTQHQAVVSMLESTFQHEEAAVCLVEGDLEGALLRLRGAQPEITLMTSWGLSQVGRETFKLLNVRLLYMLWVWRFVLIPLILSFFFRWQFWTGGSRRIPLWHTNLHVHASLHVATQRPETAQWWLLLFSVFTPNFSADCAMFKRFLNTDGWKDYQTSSLNF